jgi:hypothetical protein
VCEWDVCVGTTLMTVLGSVTPFSVSLLKKNIA